MASAGRPNGIARPSWRTRMDNVACGAPKGLIEPGKTTTPNTAQPTQSAAPTIKPTRAPIQLRQTDGAAAFEEIKGLASKKADEQ